MNALALTSVALLFREHDLQVMLVDKQHSLTSSGTALWPSDYVGVPGGVLCGWVGAMCVLLSLRSRAILPLSCLAELATDRDGIAFCHESFNWGRGLGSMKSVTEDGDAELARARCCGCSRSG